MTAWGGHGLGWCCWNSETEGGLGEGSVERGLKGHEPNVERWLMGIWKRGLSKRGETVHDPQTPLNMLH